MCEYRRYRMQAEIFVIAYVLPVMAAVFEFPLTLESKSIHFSSMCAGPQMWEVSK